MPKKWVKISEEKGGCYPHPLAIGMHASAGAGKLIYELIGQPQKGFFLDSLTIFGKGNTAYYFYEEQFDAAASDLFESLKSNPQLSKIIRRKHLYCSKKLVNLGEEIKRIDIKSTQNHELAKMFRKQVKNISELWAWGLTISILEYKTPYISQEIEHKLKDKSDSYKSHLQLLLTPTKDTYFRKEKANLLEIAAKIKDNAVLKRLFLENKFKEIIKNSHPLINEIYNHNEAYKWINYYYSGPESKITEHIDRIAGHLMQDPKSELSKLKKEFADIRKKQTRLQSELNLDQDLINLIEIAREFSYLKALRKDALYHAFHSTDLLFKEMASRLKTDLQHLRQLLPHELDSLFLGKTMLNIDSAKIRYNSCAYLLQNGQAKLLTGSDVSREASWIRKEVITETDELTGQIANLGYAKGRVTIVNNSADIKKMHEGDILVSIATNPTLVPAMRKASAIVTDIGGITCHAAIVSRELAKPCIIGTRNATKILKDGDIVEVDANKGIVTIIS